MEKLINNAEKPARTVYVRKLTIDEAAEVVFALKVRVIIKKNILIDDIKINEKLFN